MPINRFYFDGHLEQGRTIEIAGPEYHHLHRVCRVTAGEEVELVNGQGVLAVAKVENKAAHLLVLRVSTTPPPVRNIALAIPLMRPSKLEWVVEKAVELGAHELRLFAAERSDKISLSTNALERLRHLTVAAMKQSGRLFLPPIASFTSLQRAIQIDAQLLFGDLAPTAPSILGASLAAHKTLLFVSGPEQGFSPEELALLRQKGSGVLLSPYTLRAETAPLVAMGALALLLI